MCYNRNMENEIDTMQLNVTDINVAGAIKAYVKILLEYNEKANVISRKITIEGLTQLLNESILLNDYISMKVIVDAGSGNGILAYPIALLNPDKKTVLVEPQKKKFLFLKHLSEKLRLRNIDLRNVSIEEYLKSTKKESRTLIARGFPEISAFCGFLKKKLINEAVTITSENKIRNIESDMENILNKTYNIPLRDDLKILKIGESTSWKQ